jgi:hypothetical protein
MGKTFARSLTVAGLGVVLAVPTSFGGSAFADPKNGDAFDLTCGSTTYQVLVNGQGNWTPAHDTHSNLVFVPHAFQGFSGTVYDPAGNVVDTFSDPGIETQGSGKQKNDMSCTFGFSYVSDGSNPDDPPAGYTVSGSGGVSGQIAGHR